MLQGCTLTVTFFVRFALHDINLLVQLLILGDAAGLQRRPNGAYQLNGARSPSFWGRAYTWAARMSTPAPWE